MVEKSGSEFRRICKTMDVKMCFTRNIGFEDTKDIVICFTCMDYIRDVFRRVILTRFLLSERASSSCLISTFC
jgi:hypothetical protein